MAEVELDLLGVGALLEEEGGAGVAEGVEADPGEPDAGGCFFDVLEGVVAVDWSAVAVLEEGGCGGGVVAGAASEFAEGVFEFGADREGAAAVAAFGWAEFAVVEAAADVQLVVVEVEVVPGEGACFGDAEPGVGEELDQEAPGGLGGDDEFVELFLGECFGPVGVGVGWW